MTSKNKSKKEEKLTKMEKNNPIVITSIISGVVLIIALTALLMFQNIVSPSGDTINVQGTATVKAMPDLIVVYVNIENKGTTSDEANSKNAVILDEMIDSLIKREGFGREDIVTNSFNIYPDYTYSNGIRKDNGYRAIHSLSIEINASDPTKASRVIGIALDSGATVSNINFELTQEAQNKYKAEAMKQASEDATIKAEAVAEGLGKKVGKLVSVSVNNWGYQPWYGYDAIASSVELKQAESSIQPGNQDISASVSVVFKLE
ncbi:SIMPL domain-containing protein [archaeon]|nr:SIMPL domain-containing protein [archaeon]